LTWSSGALANAADIHITVANAQDLAGNVIGTPNSGESYMRPIFDEGTIIHEIIAGLHYLFIFINNG